MKKPLALCGVLMIVVLSLSVFAATASASTVNRTLTGKGAVAQWHMSTSAGLHVINAYIVMSDSGKDGKIYVSIQHPRGVTANLTAAEFKWNMNHVTVEATNLDFKLTGDTASGFTGKHNITITWQTSGEALQTPLAINTGYGLIGILSGQWKSAAASMTLDSTAQTGHHTDDVYESNWAVVFQGTADLTITMPATAPT